MALVDFPAREVRRVNQALADQTDEYAEYNDDGELIDTSAVPEYLVRATQGYPNLALDMSDEKLGRIGQKVCRETAVDERSRKKWTERNDLALKLATQNPDPKNTPWEGAANVVLPLITTASIQFAARAYPAMVQPPIVVKGQVVGSDKGMGMVDPATGQPVWEVGPDGQPVIDPETGQPRPKEVIKAGAKQERADRIAKHMSYQLLEEMDGWEEETDQLLHIVPLLGTVFRKTYYDPGTSKNCSELILPDKCIVNYWVKSLDRAPRITHEFEKYPWEVQEKFRTDEYKRCDLGRSDKDGDDDDSPHTFYEQHRRLDLDDDGYDEPYIVTVHKQTQKVVRIVARWDVDGVQINDRGEVAQIRPVQYFEKYGFIPSLDGSFYDVGFGILLAHHNEAINGIINRLLDAGTLANMGAGFYGKTAGMDSAGPLRFRPGEFKPIAMVPGQSGALLPLQQLVFPEPSSVLFQMLGLLIDSAKELSSVQDVLTGDQPGSNVPATTTLAMIEQGLKVFSGIIKRQFRSLKGDYKKLYRLNSLYLSDEAYFRVLDEEGKVSRDDYRAGDADVVPVADPNVVTDMQELARAQFLMQFAADPLFNPLEIRKRILAAGKIPNTDELLIEPNNQPDPLALEAQQAARDMHIAELRLKTAQTVLTEAQAVKAIADAEKAEVGSQLDQYKAFTDRLKLQIGMANGEGSVPGVAGSTDNAGVPEVPQGLPGGPDGAMGAGLAAIPGGSDPVGPTDQPAL